MQAATRRRKPRILTTPPARRAPGFAEFGDETLFLGAPSFRLYAVDFLRCSSIPRESIDLTITSPPYNVEKLYGTYDDKVPYEEYLRFNRDWLKRCLELTRPTGRLCLNLPLDKNRPLPASVYADVTSIAREVGWKYHATIIWNEQNISRRTAWGSWRSASAPFVIAPVETIGVWYKDSWKRRDGSRRSTVSRDEFIAWTNGLWTFSGESSKRVGHPAPFPLELPERCIKLFSFEEDVVLDPFAGSGTTLVSAMQQGRYAVGTEIDPTFCEVAACRLRNSPLRNETVRREVRAPARTAPVDQARDA